MVRATSRNFAIKSFIHDRTARTVRSDGTFSTEFRRFGLFSPDFWPLVRSVEQKRRTARHRDFCTIAQAKASQISLAICKLDASWTQVGHKLDTSQPKSTRHPETIFPRRRWHQQPASPIATGR